MKPNLAISVFLLILTASVWTGIDSLCHTRLDVRRDVAQALAQTLRSCPADEITPDTIRVFRNHIAQAQLRDTAYLAMEWQRQSHRRAVLTAHSGLSLWDLWQLSDQRASGILAALAALWLLLNIGAARLGPAQAMQAAQLAQAMPSAQSMPPVPSAQLALAMPSAPAAQIAQPEQMQAGIAAIGPMLFDPAQNRFYVHGSELHFTPMQHQLMQLFFCAPDHRLEKSDICEHLWPRKPDASATLYTLIRRIKPIIEQQSGLRIECERGRSYTLIPS